MITNLFGARSDGSDSRWILARDVLAILILSLTINLAGNGRVGLWDRDEPRYATCTREMRERGDWLHPTFNGQPRYHKPILIYWLMRADSRSAAIIHLVLGLFQV